MTEQEIKSILGQKLVEEMQKYKSLKDKLVETPEDLGAIRKYNNYLRWLKGKYKTFGEVGFVAEPKTDSKVESAGDYWRIEGVNYRDEIKNYRLSKSLLEAGTQEQLAERSLEARANNGLYCPDMPLIISIFESVMNADNTEAKNFIQSSIRNKYPSTLTRNIYNPQGQLDKIIHNYKQPNEYSLEGNIVGKDDWIKNISDKDILELLTGRNQTQLDEIFQYLNETNTHIWRVNNKPSKKQGKDERVARLGADSDRAYLLFVRLPSYVSPCFGLGEVL